mmetsp:Transcript_58272/g.115661  ORF Transcript_58272/g.115661 Transcript_58272/m.115661 type:complete len:246 (+) Transcript_58272:3-740(+)
MIHMQKLYATLCVCTGRGTDTCRVLSPPWSPIIATILSVHNCRMHNSLAHSPSQRRGEMYRGLHHGRSWGSPSLLSSRCYLRALNVKTVSWPRWRQRRRNVALMPQERGDVAKRQKRVVLRVVVFAALALRPAKSVEHPHPRHLAQMVRRALVEALNLRVERRKIAEIDLPLMLKRRIAQRGGRAPVEAHQWVAVVRGGHELGERRCRPLHRLHSCLSGGRTGGARGMRGASVEHHEVGRRRDVG